MAWAALEPPAVTLITFAAIGVGMSLPYLLLSAVPGLTDKMPKAGPASELIKQLMGLLMLSAAAYFVGVGLSGLLAEPPEPPSRVYFWFVAAIVVLADLYYPGWEATDNGRPVRILRANTICRAVALGVGQHTLRFVYRPQGFTRGLWIAAATLLVLLVVTAVRYLPLFRIKSA